jgi:Chalcone isomerase-like
MRTKSCKKIGLGCLPVSILATLLLLGPKLSAAEIGGVRFNETISFEQNEVRLRGEALLQWMGMVKLYAGALYLPEDHPADHWDEEVPMVLELAYFRAINAVDFGTASDRLLRQALSEGAYQALAERLQALYSLFRDVKPGDRYALKYLPGAGTELYLNNTFLGRVVGDDFAKAYFGIWLGEKPLSKDFRDQLLSAN